MQFNLLIEYLYKCALYSASFVAAQTIENGKIGNVDYDPVVATPFYFGLIVISMVAGCLLSYLETRTRLMLLFIAAENANKDDRNQKLRLAPAGGDRPLAQNQPASAGAGGRVRPQEPVPTRASREDERIASLSFDDVKNNLASLIGWASAKTRLRQFDDAEKGFREALKQDPKDDMLRRQIVEVKRLAVGRLGAVEEAVKMADDTANPQTKNELLRDALYEALYVTPPDGFTQAVAISTKLLADPANKSDSTLFLWRSAALGQQYSWLQDQQAPAAELKAVWDEALKAVQKVVELNVPTDRALLRSMYEGTLPDENDLAVFKNHADRKSFDDLIFKPAQ